METPKNTAQYLSEAIVTEIVARLPLRSISRFKSVCRTWKSALESAYFRRLFVSLHQNTSSSWSLLAGTEEFISMHGCETWDLPKSIASYFRGILTRKNLYHVASSSGLILMESSDDATYVGNPVLQQWLRIPDPPHPTVTVVLGLVTSLDEDGVVLSFKVVKMAALVPTRDKSSTCMFLWVYSSETGIWTRKRLYCPICFTSFRNTISLNGTFYVSQTCLDGLATQPGTLMAHDFYSESDLWRVIPFPDHNLNHNMNFKRALTKSRGYVMYIKTLAQEGDNLLKVWRLSNDSGDECWKLLWEIRLPFDNIRNYAPMAMHPLEHNIVYLWSEENHYMISCNLQTQNYKILRDDDHQDCLINKSRCDKYMDEALKSSSVQEYGVLVNLDQFVLPKWMKSLPRPPQVEMLDTASLISYVSSLPKEHEDYEEEEEDVEEEWEEEWKE
ncbi:putative F-box/kelch-repeat protein At4g22430 [Capsella rubella]|nr:putative F-box/kelch-repeat protein At4g22430 [Capsella rubella]